jgi:hypothetical protein
MSGPEKNPAIHHVSALFVFARDFKGAHVPLSIQHGVCATQPRPAGLSASWQANVFIGFG